MPKQPTIYTIQLHDMQRRLILKALHSLTPNSLSDAKGSGQIDWATERDEYHILINMLETLETDKMGGLCV